MRICAKIYIGAILAGGVACFAHAMEGWNCRHPLQYLCLLAVALPASNLKVFLPGVAGTISVSYVFVLLGMLDFSYPETVLLACLAMLVQCWWRGVNLLAPRRIEERAGHVLPQALDILRILPDQPPRGLLQRIPRAAFADSGNAR